MCCLRRRSQKEYDLSARESCAPDAMGFSGGSGGGGAHRFGEAAAAVAAAAVGGGGQHGAAGAVALGAAVAAAAAAVGGGRQHGATGLGANALVWTCSVCGAFGAGERPNLHVHMMRYHDKEVRAASINKRQEKAARSKAIGSGKGGGKASGSGKGSGIGSGEHGSSKKRVERMQRRFKG